MDLLVVLLASALFPVGCLAFLLWMSRIEDSIPDAVRKATRMPDPPPVLAIPVAPPGHDAGRRGARAALRAAGDRRGTSGRADAAGRGRPDRDLGHLPRGRCAGPGATAGT